MDNVEPTTERSALPRDPLPTRQSPAPFDFATYRIGYRQLPRCSSKCRIGAVAFYDPDAYPRLP